MGHEISIIRPDREPLVLAVDDSSYRRREIMGEDELVLNFSLAVYEEIPAGSTVTFEGDTYTLFQSCRVDKRGSRNFEYQATFSADYAYLRKYMFYNWVDKRLSFDLTARPWEHIQMIVDNLNARLQSGDAPWRLGEGCIESAEKLISYSCNNCMEALQAVADTFETEWEVKGRTIFLRKVEYNADSPLELSYGRGNGLRAGIQRTAYNDETPAARVYIQGGERNIFLSEYGSRELKFPKSSGIGYDGEKYEGEGGYDNAKAVRYITDDLGQSVAREGGPVNGGDDVALDLTHIYPSHTCEVESVEYHYKSETYGSIDELVAAYPELADEDAEGWDNVQVDIIVKEDAYLPDYSASELQVPGETRQVVFQSGNLVSREFDINDYNHEGRRFKLVSEWVDGFRMPAGPVYHPSAGNTFIVVGVSLPSEYVSEAEDKALREAVKYLYEHETQKVTINAEIDPIQAARMWDSWGPKIILGGFVRLTDDDLLAEVSDIRIRAVKQYVNTPAKPVVELSNSTASVSFGTTIRELENQEVHTDELHKDSRQFTKRRFADIRRAMKMLEDAFGEGFDPSLKPVTIQTMMMLVGDETLQFAFVEAIGSDKVVPHNEYFDTETKTFKCDAGFIKHYTLDVKEIRSKFDQTYRYWTMPQYESAVLDDASKEYYVYAIVSKVGDDLEINRFSLEPSAIGMRDKESEGEYYLLLGLLLAERDGERDYMPLYGFTQILPGQVTTDVIRSADGQTYFDLVNGVISGKIRFEAGSTGLENIEGYLNIGNQNMLRNSGFTGDYLSEPLADETVMDAAKVLYSDPLDHWHTNGTATVIDLERATSGKGVSLVPTEELQGHLSQNLYNKTIVGENYVISFYAKTLADSTANVSVNCGGVHSRQEVTGEWKKYTLLFEATDARNEFSIYTDGEVTICDLQLERGTIATAWGMSPLDNSSDRTYYQALKYLSQALAGSTTMAGGLVLTNTIMLGNESNNSEFVERAGANGLYFNDDDTPAFWAGGTMQQAIETIAKYKDNPSYEPTEEELKTMAQFVVTHGGRVILNDAIYRGTVYSKGGFFGGRLQMPFTPIASACKVVESSSPETTYELTTASPSHIVFTRDYSTAKALRLPNNEDFDGWVLNVYVPPRVSSKYCSCRVIGDGVVSPTKVVESGLFKVVKSIPADGGYMQFLNIDGEWYWLNEEESYTDKIRTIDVSSSTSSIDNRYDLTGVEKLIISSYSDSGLFCSLPQEPHDGEEVSIIAPFECGVSVKSTNQQIVIVRTGQEDTFVSTDSAFKGELRFFYTKHTDKWICIETIL